MKLPARKNFNFLILPRKGKSFFSVAISPLFLVLLAIVIIVSAVLNVRLTMKYTEVKKQLQAANMQIMVDSQVSDLLEVADELREDMNALAQNSERLAEKTGIAVEASVTGDRYSSYSSLSGKEKAMPTRSADPRISEIRSELDSIRQEIDINNETVVETEKQYDTVMKRLSRTPSINPVRKGKINSRFGYRTHPISRRVEMHKGIDIEGDYMTPIYASADGTISFSGWRGGYGRTIQIDHGNGYETLYAHNARNLVNEGDTVKKGRIIAYMGSSGYATGTHLHYEVHLKDRLMNPEEFLNITYRDLLDS